MLEFSVLGPLEVRVDGIPHQVQGAFQKTLLIALLLSHGGLVPNSAVMHELWGAGHPSRPENALQAHVSRLRRRLDTLEPNRGSSRLVSRGSGYQLFVDEGELDARVFLRRVEELETAAGACPPAVRGRRLRESLAMWRGPVLGGVVGGRICHAGANDYEEARLRALTMLFDAELEQGNQAAVVAELSALVTSYSPSQERFCEQLMVALYRCGRQGDALEVYRRTVDQLASVGATPSARLRGCERAVLTQDPMLEFRPNRLVTVHGGAVPGGLVHRQVRRSMTPTRLRFSV